jgi:EAL domain-containing protein (putative c-di-GMP-specific phosphodiesterase class I)
MTQRAMDRLNMETMLRRAIDRDEFVLHYQPRVDLATNRIVGAEALVRWQHPERGLIHPFDFIGLAEEAKLIIPLGEWVLHAVCAQQAKWRAAGVAPIQVAVNLAASHLREPSLPGLVTHNLVQYGLPADSLGIEVTESVLLEDPEESIKNANTLARWGVSLSLDDFGIGYSSLSYLKRLPVSQIKIDQSFVRDLTVDASDAAIITAIIAMAHTLGIGVVAEGVEHEAQRAFLQQHGCNEYQGYLFSTPVPAAEFAKMVVDQPEAPASTSLVRSPPLVRVV